MANSDGTVPWTIAGRNEVRNRQTRRGVPKHGAAMTFDEIGKALGITRGGAWMAYQSAMRKLSRLRRAQLERMRELAASKGRP